MAKRKRKRVKPERPPDFPLFAHASGQWAKKIKGRLRYFGSWDDPEQALENYQDFTQGQPRAGRLKVADPQVELSIDRLVQLFLADRDELSQMGEIQATTFEDYKPIGRILIDFFGDHTHVDKLRPHHFAALKTHLSKRKPPHRAGRKPKGKAKRKPKGTAKDLPRVSPKTLEGRIARARAFFNWAAENDYIDTPLRKLWGTQFRKPDRKLLVKERNLKPRKLLEPGEIIAILGVASPAFKAMILLGINGGIGNTDAARITLDHLDLKNGWLDLPRKKTGEPRRVPLWPETVEAIREALASRPDPENPENATLLFLTKYRSSWMSRGERIAQNPVAQEFARLRKLAGVSAGGKSFYSLRHTFATIASSAKDIDAVTYLMGHQPQTVRARDYLEARPDDDRLRACVEVVRQWLFKPTNFA